MNRNHTLPQKRGKLVTSKENSPQSPAVTWLRDRPIAHRGLHDPAKGIYENTLSAAKAAMEAGYAIEVDLQFSADGVPVVFHDYTLDRMTSRTGDVRGLTVGELGGTKIMKTDDHIPALSELLELIQGKVAIVLELKGKAGNDVGFLAAVARELEDYSGNIAIMSFNHHLLRDAREYAPHLTLGLTAEGDDATFETHHAIADEARVDFVSYELANLDTRFVRECRENGRPVISWTVRSPEDAAYSAKFADQPTFEGFMA